MPTQSDKDKAEFPATSLLSKMHVTDPDHNAPTLTLLTISHLSISLVKCDEVLMLAEYWDQIT